MLQGPVVENLSKRCGGFLKALSLRGCQVITDQALGYACPLSLGLWIVKGVVVGEGGGGQSLMAISQVIRGHQTQSAQHDL